MRRGSLWRGHQKRARPGTAVAKFADEGKCGGRTGGSGFHGKTQHSWWKGSNWRRRRGRRRWWLGSLRYNHQPGHGSHYLHHQHDAQEPAVVGRRHQRHSRHQEVHKESGQGWCVTGTPGLCSLLHFAHPVRFQVLMCTCCPAKSVQDAFHKPTRASWPALRLATSAFS